MFLTYERRELALVAKVLYIFELAIFSQTQKLTISISEIH